MKAVLHLTQPYPNSSMTSCVHLHQPVPLASKLIHFRIPTPEHPWAKKDLLCFLLLIRPQWYHFDLWLIVCSTITTTATTATTTTTSD